MSTTKRGRGRPPTTGERLILRISPDLLARVDADAEATGVDRSSYVRAALEARLGTPTEELEAWRLGREAGIREAQAAVGQLRQPERGE